MHAEGREGLPIRNVNAIEAEATQSPARAVSAWLRPCALWPTYASCTVSRQLPGLGHLQSASGATLSHDLKNGSRNPAGTGRDPHNVMDIDSPESHDTPLARFHPFQ